MFNNFTGIYMNSNFVHHGKKFQKLKELDQFFLKKWLELVLTPLIIFWKKKKELQNQEEKPLLKLPVLMKGKF